MYGFVLGLHLVVCLALVGVILIQSSKGGGLAGGAFGGATQTVFGGRGATDFITKATIWLGIAFFTTSLTLALLSTRGGLTPHQSLLQQEAKKAAAQSPAQLPQGSAPSKVPTATPAPAPATGTPIPATGGHK